jgi:hypothetical protein
MDIGKFTFKRSIISCKWILKRKYKAHSVITHYKTYLVAHSFTQEKGINYDKTFSPMVKISSLCTLLSLATIYDLQVHQMDVKTTFFYGHLHEKIYMAQLEGYVDPKY